MKLLFFISSMRGGGAERVMSIICNSLAERGHKVYLATNLRLPVMYELSSSVNLVDYSVCYNTKNKLIKLQKKLQKTREIIKKVNPDIIVSFIWKISPLAIFGALGLKIPVIVSERNSCEKRISLKEHIVRYYINRLATKVVLLTISDYNFLKKRLSNLVVIPNPCTFHIYTQNDINSRKKNVIAVGSLNRWYAKGFDNLIKIWAELAYEYIDWNLVIYGEGRDESLRKLKLLAEEYNVIDRINFAGYVKDTQEIMITSPIFILSSRYEGYPNVLAEAMTQGCACICFDCKTGPNEMLRHNESGFLVSDQNIEEMKIFLAKLMDDASLREQFSLNAKKDAEKFEPTNIINKWEDLLMQNLNIK